MFNSKNRPRKNLAAAKKDVLTLLNSSWNPPRENESESKTVNEVLRLESFLSGCEHYVAHNTDRLRVDQIRLYRDHVEEACSTLPPNDRYITINSFIEYLYYLKDLDTSASKTYFSGLLSIFSEPSGLNYFSEMFSAHFKHKICHPLNWKRFGDMEDALMRIKCNYDAKVTGPFSLFQANTRLQIQKVNFIEFLLDTLGDIKEDPNTKIPNGIRTNHDFIHMMKMDWLGPRSEHEDESVRKDRKQALDPYDQRGFAEALRENFETIVLLAFWHTEYDISLSKKAANSKQALGDATQQETYSQQAESDPWTRASEEPTSKSVPAPAFDEETASSQTEPDDDHHAGQARTSYSR